MLIRQTLRRLWNWFLWRTVAGELAAGDRVQLTNGDWCEVLAPPRDYGGQTLVQLTKPLQRWSAAPHFLAPLSNVARRVVPRWSVMTRRNHG